VEGSILDYGMAVPFVIQLVGAVESTQKLKDKLIIFAGFDWIAAWTEGSK
jgi:hypothetical protein